MTSTEKIVPLSVKQRDMRVHTRPGSTNRPHVNARRAEICIALDTLTLDEIREFRKREYRSVYPAMDLDNDGLDQQAIVLYSRDESGAIISTARLGFDGPLPLPEERYLGSFRQRRQRIIELGRFISRRGGLLLLKNYYRAFYTIARRTGCHVIVMAMQPGHIRFHQNKMGVEIIAQETGVTYGGKHNLACVAWHINHTQPEFYQWIAS